MSSASKNQYDVVQITVHFLLDKKLLCIDLVNMNISHQVITYSDCRCR